AHAINLHSALSAAVLLRDNRVLCNGEETAREVPGLCSTEGSVGETFTRAVGVHEVLNRIQALGHRRGNSDFDRLSRGVLDETLHTGHLCQVAQGAARAR